MFGCDIDCEICLHLNQPFNLGTRSTISLSDPRDIFQEGSISEAVGIASIFFRLIKDEP